MLDELKHHKENVVPGLEKQCQTLQLELQKRGKMCDVFSKPESSFLSEHTANTTITEREKHYEHQIKQYQQAISQMTEENNQVRDELRHMQKENALKDGKTEAFINELKQNYERVQHELIELNDRGMSILAHFSFTPNFFRRTTG